MSLRYLKDDYLLGDVRFLTFKGTAKKHQSIGFINDKCRKISSTYSIVREANKATPGYHFHAILKCNTAPKKSWFIKGVHMNLQRVGKPLTAVSYPLNLKEVSQCLYFFPETAATLYAEQLDYKLDQVMEKFTQKSEDLDKILTYMSKELEHPIQFTDYIISRKGKQTVLPAVGIATLD